MSHYSEITGMDTTPVELIQAYEDGLVTQYDVKCAVLDMLVLDHAQADDIWNALPFWVREAVKEAVVNFPDTFDSAALAGYSDEQIATEYEQYQKGKKNAALLRRWMLDRHLIETSTAV